MKTLGSILLFAAAAAAVAMPARAGVDAPLPLPRFSVPSLPRMNASSRGLEKIVVECLRRQLGEDPTIKLGVARVMKSRGHQVAFGESEVYWASVAGKKTVGAQSFHFLISDLDGMARPMLSVRVAGSKQAFDRLDGVTRIDVVREDGVAVLRASFEEGVFVSPPNRPGDAGRAGESLVREAIGMSVAGMVSDCILFPRYGGVREARFQARPWMVPSLR